MSVDIFSLIEQKKVKMVDLRFTDTRGKEQSITVPAEIVDTDFLKEGKMFDGSSIPGWQSINDSDMILMPQSETATLDPFCDNSTLSMRCNIHEPKQHKPYERCPRSLALRAEAYLHYTGIADQAFFGPEAEFFIFDHVAWDVSMERSYFEVDSIEGSWNSGCEYPDGNKGHRPRVKGGYLSSPPVDSTYNMRTAMCETMQNMGIAIEVHHREVATAQSEIGMRFNTLTRKADELQTYKYVVQNVAHAYGKTATFMPKPLVGDNGSGMHVHQSLFKQGQNLFSGDLYGGLSETALFYIGGIIKHAKALNAFCNPGTNSYKRLVPGFEAPVMLAYSMRNRSAAIRIPHVVNAKGRRIEARFPDALANPYLAFSALMMAGLDGIKKRLHPGDAIDRDLYHLSAQEKQTIPQVAGSLEEALMALNQDKAFLLEGDVFTEAMINSYLELKMQDVERLRMATHPLEYEMYY